MSRSSHRMILGEITARHGAVTAADPPVSVGDESTITYDAVGYLDIVSMERLVYEIKNQIPKRRASKGAKIIPASVGDPCEIRVQGSMVFLFVKEGIPFMESCP